MHFRRAFRVAAVAFLGAIALCRAATPTASRPAKLGIGRVFPISYRNSDGKLTGFAIDVLNEAARREQVAVEWTSVKSSKDSENDLQDGRIDLLPAGMVTPERQRMFYVSEPWWSTETTLVSRVDNRRLDRIGINPIYAAVVKDAFPNSLLVPYTWADWAVKAVCRGEVDGALIAHGELHDIFLNRPEECNGIRMTSGDTRASIQLAIIARKADAAFASRLRRRIDEMASDGTLMRMAVQNPPIPTAAAAQFEQRLRDRLHQRVWAVGSGLIAAFLVFCVWNRQRNLSRSKRTEAELRNLHDRLALKHQVARIGTYEWFVAENRIVWSREMEMLYGMASETHEHTFQEWESFVHPEDLTPTLNAMKNAVAQQQATLDATYRIFKSDRTIAWIHNRGQYEYDSTGRPVHMLGVNIDITDQRRVEEELDRANRTMKLAMEAGNSGAWTWSIDSGELFWTEEFSRLLGIDPGIKPTPELFYSFVHPDDVGRLKAGIDACLSGTRREFCIEFRIKSPDGFRWIERRGRICQDRNGRPVQLVGISTDVTERKILRGLLSTCAQCKKVQDEQNHWQPVDRYISEHSEARISHGLCPDCADQWAQEEGLEGECIEGFVSR